MAASIIMLLPRALTANAVGVDWCPGSPIQICRMGCFIDDKPLCKSTQFCAMRDWCCGFKCLAAPEAIDEPATDGSPDEAKAAEATPAPTFEAAFGSDDLRFSTARNKKFELFAITESGSIGAKCSQQCNAMAECLGYYWFVTKSGGEKCRGLSYLGNDKGTAETKTAAHASFKKILLAAGQEGLWQPALQKQFKRKFQGERRLLTSMKGRKNRIFVKVGITDAECATECAGRADCVGFVVITKKAGERTKCVGVSTLGKPKGAKDKNFASKSYVKA